MIFYLLAPTTDQALAEAEKRGWTRIARARCVTPKRDEVRLISRFSDLVPVVSPHPTKGATTWIMRAASYKDGPPATDPLGRLAWLGDEETGQVGDKAKFEKFIADGHGKWFDHDEPRRPQLRPLRRAV